MANPAGRSNDGVLKLDFDRRLRRGSAAAPAEIRRAARARGKWERED